MIVHGNAGERHTFSSPSSPTSRRGRVLMLSIVARN